MIKSFEKILIQTERSLRAIPIPGTQISLYHVLSELWKKIITFDIDQRAAAVSFSLILAVFPGVIFLFTLIPYIPINNLEVQVMDFLENILPRGIYDTVAHTIRDIVSRRRVDVLSFGFFFAVFAATNGMMALTRAFNIAIKKRNKRSILQARYISFLLTLLLIVVLIVAIATLIIGKLILQYLLTRGIVNEDINLVLIQALSYLSVFIIFFVGICSIYFFGPDVKKRFNFFSVGAAIASVLCIVATNLFSFYLANFNSYNKLYGSIGTLIGVMVWIYLISLILIFGFEINISVREAISQSKSEKRKTPQQSSARGVS